jgi:hydrogenase maturation protease
MKAQANKRTLVIGLGSPLSRDDAFGLLVLKHLTEQTPAPPSEADFASADTDLIDQIDHFQTYSRVILLDSVLDPFAKIGRPGDVVLLHEDSFLAWPETSPSVHQLSPLLAIKLFRQLYPEAKTRITLVAFCVDHVGAGSTAGETLDEHIVDAAARLVLSLLSQPEQAAAE